MFKFAHERQNDLNGWSFKFKEVVHQKISKFSVDCDNYLENSVKTHTNYSFVQI